MTYLTSYIPQIDGILAYRQNRPCVSSGLSIRPNTAPAFDFEDTPKAIINHLCFTFSLLSSMATISSGLTISHKRKKVKAKFNRDAYAKGIQESANLADNGAVNLQITTFKRADYSFHIKETAGKILECSKPWYK